MIHSENNNSYQNPLIQVLYHLELTTTPHYSLQQIQEFFNHESYLIFFLFLKNQENSWVPFIKTNHFFRKNHQKPIPYTLNRCIGYVLYQKIPSENLIELHKILIDPLYRNQQYGTFLIKKTIQYWKKLKYYNKILLEVSEENHQAIHLYKKLGFKVINIRKNYYKDNKHALIMMLNF